MYTVHGVVRILYIVDVLDTALRPSWVALG